MRTGIVLFATGMVAVAFLPALPSAWCWPALAGAALVLFRWPRLRPAAWLFLGVAWAGAVGAMALAHRLPQSLEGADVTVVGRVSSIPEPADHRTRFRFTPSEITPWPADRPLPRRIRLSWYARKPPALHPGERWRLVVRLKRPHGFSNPGGFDYETWLFANGVDAVGYVRSPRDARRLSGPAGLDSLRERLSRRLEAVLTGHASLGVVIALAVGDRRLIGDDTWRLLRSTGTGHLVAISGLHVGMVALAGLFLFGGLWRRFPRLCLSVPAPLAGRCGAVAAAAAYAALAGFSLPTQRALLMVVGAAGVSLFRRRARPFDLWLAALAAVLAWDPLAPLSPGFWLSFGAVGVLIATGVGRYSARGWDMALAGRASCVVGGVTAADGALVRPGQLVGATGEPGRHSRGHNRHRAAGPGRVCAAGALAVARAPSCCNGRQASPTRVWRACIGSPAGAETRCIRRSRPFGQCSPPGLRRYLPWRPKVGRHGIWFRRCCYRFFWAARRHQPPEPLV